MAEIGDSSRFFYEFRQILGLREVSNLRRLFRDQTEGR